MLPEPTAPSAEQRALIIDALYELDAMLARLPSRARQAFLMAQLDGATHAEIAVELGVSDRMVRKYITQAMLQCAMLKAGVMPP